MRLRNQTSFPTSSRSRSPYPYPSRSQSPNPSRSQSPNRSRSQSPNPSRSQSPSQSRQPVPEPEPEPAPVPEPEPEPVPKPGPAPSFTPVGTVPAAGAAEELVQALLAAAPSLYGVAETAGVIADEAMARVEADGVAVLVPDDNEWRVAAGVGLRALEMHIGLPDDAWLVRQVAQADRGFIIRDSDIARRALLGVPMASKSHLMAAPVPDVGAILLVGRDHDPIFDEADLAALGSLAREATEVLRAALDVRRLARSLHDAEDRPE